MSYNEHLIFLEKLPKTKTNENRNNIIYKRTATYFGDIFKIILIISKLDSTNIFKTIGSLTTGEIIGTINILKIKYFKSIKCAFYYDLINKKFSGVFRTWYSNGINHIICTYNDKCELEGTFYEFYDNCDKKKQITYKNGILHGEYIIYHRSYFSPFKIILNSKSIFCDYENGVLNGKFNSWHENGKLWISCFYVKGSLHGKFLKWFPNGNQWIISTYDFGTRTTFIEKTKYGSILFCLDY
jgi:antitoxin component YwqK of YwqJK toxin-antitoxin module